MAISETRVRVPLDALISTIVDEWADEHRAALLTALLEAEGMEKRWASFDLAERTWREWDEPEPPLTRPIYVPLQGEAE